MQPYEKIRRRTPSEVAVSALAPERAPSTDFSLSATPFHFFSQVRLRAVPLALPRVFPASRGAHLYFYVSYDSEPVHPGPHPSRKDGLLAQDPKGGDGDRELLRFSKRRCEIEPGARDAPTSAREGASPRVQG